MAVYNLQAVYIGQDQVRPRVAVTGVSLNTNSITFTSAGQTYQLLATVTPNNATDQSVTWSTSSSSIATVSATGLVTCMTPGSATITVTTNDGGFTATCSVAQSAQGSYDLSNATLDSTTRGSIYGYIKPALSSNGLYLLSSFIDGNDNLPYLMEYNFSTAYEFDPDSGPIYQQQLSEITTTASSISLVSAVYNALGDKLYVCVSNGTDSTIYQYTLSTYFDIRTRSISTSKTFTGVNISAFRIVDHGTKLFVVWYTPTSGQSYIQSKLMKATFGTAWDVSSLGSLSEEIALNEHTVNSLAISPDGQRFYITRDGTDNNYYYQYTGSGAYSFIICTEYTGIKYNSLGNTGFDVHPSNGDIYLSYGIGGGSDIATYHT